jgi:hypothetical protein
MSNIVTDPSLVTQLGNQFEQMGEASEKEITTTPPPINEVSLPGGFISKDGLLVKYAEIRELNGADEEFIAKAGSVSGSINAVLNRGLVSLGGNSIKSSDLDELLAGDRDAILLGIRIATFGKEVHAPTVCGSCGKQQVLDINLETDVKVKELDNPIADRTFEMSTKAGEVVMCIPNGITQKKLMEASDKVTAELITIILSGCIVSVNGSPSMGRTTALSLGILDREKLVSEVYDRSPGPRLGEVSKACEACGTDIPVSFSLADLFRI